uniref:Uncharacterized protein n=1 Tax=Populus trichocarpa TaxID=3694 RepID=A0A2K1XIB1_POPTR
MCHYQLIVWSCCDQSNTLTKALWSILKKIINKCAHKGDCFCFLLKQYTFHTNVCSCSLSSKAISWLEFDLFQDVVHRMVLELFL